MPYTPPRLAKESEAVPGLPLPPTPTGSGSSPRASPNPNPSPSGWPTQLYSTSPSTSFSSARMMGSTPTPMEVSPKDRSAATFRGPELDLSVSQLPPEPNANGLPHPEPPVPLSATSSSSSSNPIFTWPSLVPGAPPPGRDPFETTHSFLDDPFAHRSSESSSGDDHDLRTAVSSATQSPMSLPSMPMSVPMSVPMLGALPAPRPSVTQQRSMDSSYSSLYSEPVTPPDSSTLHRPQPRYNGLYDPWHSVSQELADSLQNSIQNLLYVSPPLLLDSSREQYAGCSIQMPATWISSLLANLRGLNYLSANLVPICEGQAAGVRVVREFEVGAVVQTVADQLSAEQAQADVELVLLQQGDLGLRSVTVWGDREGIAFVLSHVVRQILAVASRGDTIELGFTAVPQSPRRLSETNLTNSPSGSPAPASLSNVDMLCSFEIIHNVTQTPDLSAVTPKAEVVNPFTRLVEQRAASTPKLDTPLCNRLLRQVNAWIRTDSTPTSPGFGIPRHMYEVAVALRRGRQEPVDEGPKPSFSDPSPSSGDLAEFVETLRRRKVTVFANQNSIFGRQLISHLKSLGLEVLHIDGSSSEPPESSSRFVIIDDDVVILRRELGRLKPESMSLRRPLKRPGLFRNSKSTTHLRPPLSSTSIIHFTSLDKYQQVREVVLNLVAAQPETLVVPKPVGPRRLLTALFTAIRQPIVDPVFSPIASSPRSPQISSGNRTPTGVPQEGFFDAMDSQADVAASKARSPLSDFPPPLSARETPRLPLSTPGTETPASEYFSRASKSTSGAAGVVLKSPDGRPLGVYFEPPGTGRATVAFSQPPPRVPNSRRTSAENEVATVAPSPTDSLHSSRRASAMSTSTEESIVADVAEVKLSPPVPPPPAPASGRRKTLPTPPDAKPILAHGRERSTTVTRVADVDRREKSLPDIAENRILARPPTKADVVVPPINVLIVEDNPINQNILSMFFRKKKIRHQTAKDGQEAVEKWRTGGFHLILMDIQLPVMDGIEATKEIRKLEKNNNIGVFPSTPLGDHQRPIEAVPASSPFRSSVIIVALTASSLQTDRVAALAAGCNDFLTKPVSLKWLEKKTVEWGCMQALIDFEGWRRWKGSDGLDPVSETKRGFQMGPEAAAHKVASRLRIDRHKWRPAAKKDENKDKDKSLAT